MKTSTNFYSDVLDCDGCIWRETCLDTDLEMTVPCSDWTPSSGDVEYEPDDERTQYRSAFYSYLRNANEEVYLGKTANGTEIHF